VVAPELEAGHRARWARWRGPIGWLCFVSFALLVPADLFSFPSSVDSSIAIDKLVHFGLFFGLSSSWYLAIRIQGAGRVVWSFLLALCLGAGLEILQTVLAWRSGEVSDVLADALGAVAGIAWSRWRFARGAGEA
jgi:VanZ family protein